MRTPSLHHPLRQIIIYVAGKKETKEGKKQREANIMGLPYSYLGSQRLGWIHNFTHPQIQSTYATTY